MGCLLIFNDSEENLYWKKNIFKLENFIISESITIFILSFIALFTFPLDSFNITKQNMSLIPIKYILLNIIFCSLISIFMSALIKYIHLNKNSIKPNYRLFIMKVLAYIAFFSIFISFISSFYITLVIIEWEKYKGSIALKSLSFHDNKSISIEKAIFTLNLSNIMFLFSILGFVDFCAECIIISKASKYLSERNNINNQKVLDELFLHSQVSKEGKNSGKNILSNINEINNKNTFSKYRLIIKDDNNLDNYFDNRNNKFQEIEIILNVEYISEGMQTENDKNVFDSDYAINIETLIDDDLSINSILSQRKSLKNIYNDIK